MSAHTPGPWIIRLHFVAVGSYKFRRPAFVADERKMRFGDWFDGLGATTKIFKRRGNAERWLRDRPHIDGIVEQHPSAAIAKAEGK